MTLKVYEYEVLDKKVGIYTGSYTLPENSPSEQALKEKYHSHLVQVYDNEDPQK